MHYIYSSETFDKPYLNGINTKMTAGDECCPVHSIHFHMSELTDSKNSH